MSMSECAYGPSTVSIFHACDRTRKIMGFNFDNRVIFFPLEHWLSIDVFGVSENNGKSERDEIHLTSNEKWHHLLERTNRFISSSNNNNGISTESFFLCEQKEFSWIRRKHERERGRTYSYVRAYKRRRWKVKKERVPCDGRMSLTLWPRYTHTHPCRTYF